MKELLILPCVVGTVASATGALPARAQTLIESADGETSIALPFGGFAGLNFSSKKAKVGYAWQVSTSPLAAGVEVAAKAKDGAASLLKNGDPVGQYEGEFRGSYQISRLGGAGVMLGQWVTGGVKYVRSTETLIDTLNAVSNDSTFSGVRGQVGYNAFLNVGGSGEVLAGGAVSWGGVSNAKELGSAEICSELGRQTADPNVFVQSCKAGRQGAYEEGTSLGIAVDLIWWQRWARNRVAIAGLYRWDSFQEEHSGGGGVVVSQSGAPLQIIGGAHLQYKQNDWLLVLQAGLPFS